MTMEELIKRTYAAFNGRDIEAVLAVMHTEVDWPNGMEGGRVIGHDEVRSYWSRQWNMLDPSVTPERFVIEEDGRVAVDVHQVVRDPRYRQNPLRQQLWRAGHAHAGVLLVLSLLVLLYVDQTDLSATWKQVVRSAIPSAAIFLPTAFFLSVLRPTATKPNVLIYLAYAGAVVLAFGLVVLGIGLL